ncbi:MAG: HD domain-containing phosphohydrolase, partial [Hyphomicrobium sp.]|uniref:HD domain-containing phosphohydrolase n=1 Tax=Hyphomicrobium sp. TaxID=82 RepID=UPI003D09C5EF
VLSEVDRLSRALGTMKATIRRFVRVGNAMSAQRHLPALLNRVLVEALDIANGKGGVIYLLDSEGRQLNPQAVSWGDEEPAELLRRMLPLSLGNPALPSEMRELVKDTGSGIGAWKLDAAALALLGFHAAADDTAEARSVFAMPLLNRSRAAIGVLLIVDPSRGGGVTAHLEELLLAIGSGAGIAIENQQLLQAQKDLMNALIKLIAGSIDAKSPYTGGHCQRVPVLTHMLAEAACAETEGPFADFRLSPEEWEAVDIASWLHDCGKVTTPEYVVDKATKLEGIHDRLHEIRMRFEVLKRDVEVAYWQGWALGGSEDRLRVERDAAWRTLDEEFAFVASCNEGGEFMDPDRIERLRRIGARRWRRTLDDRIGISYEERERKSRTPAPHLPVDEPLLADREDHLTHRKPEEAIDADNPWGIRVEVPPYRFNRGELHNLSIGRGTLTAEERYIINDHMTQTIMMLESLPLPRHLRNVPEIAGGHHEKMDGTGYPKRLKRDEMSPVARIMAIADVFEALTAGDRPYKKAKTLSEAIKIMAFMKRDNHLDPDLLDLFIRANVWKDYAERFLAAEQIDTPDVEFVLAMRPAKPVPPAPKPTPAPLARSA